MPNDPVEAARLFLDGRKMLRPELVTMVQGLLDLVKTAEPEAKPAQKPGTCSVEVSVTAQKTVYVGPDANKFYTPQEATEFAGKIYLAAEKARGALK